MHSFLNKYLTLVKLNHQQLTVSVCFRGTGVQVRWQYAWQWGRWRVILVDLAQLLCENYGKDPLLTMLVNETRIHLMPTMNPDGFSIATEGRTCQFPL